MRDFGASRVREVKPSATTSIADKAKQMLAEGRDIIDLSVGDPQFKTPEYIIREAERAVERGDTHYAPSRGIPRLLKAIQQKFERDNGLQYAADEIVVTPGGKHAIYSTLMATVEQGDDVLLFSPAWVSYEPCVQLAGGRPVFVPLEGPDFRISPEVLRSVDAPNAKVMVFNSPNNPTGRVATEDELRAIAELAQERDLLVISDELYEHLLYGGRTHTSLATLPGMRDRTITVNGVSKTYAMTGWRLGYLAGPKPVVSQVFKVHQHSVTSAATFTQVAAACALEAPQDAVSEMLREYDSNRQMVVDALNVMPGVICADPEGAFYAFPRIEGKQDSVAFSAELLEKSGVAVTPGVAFGPTGEGYIRLSFATSPEQLRQGLDRMREALGG